MITFLIVICININIWAEIVELICEKSADYFIGVAITVVIEIITKKWIDNQQ